MSDEFATREISPFGLTPGTRLYRETAHGLKVDEYIVEPVRDTMSCRGAHYLARRGDTPNAKGGRIICFDAASMVLVRA